MNINDFLSNYKSGTQFKKVKYKRNTHGGAWGFYKFNMIDHSEWNFEDNGVYILVINEEIVYIGSSGRIYYRLRRHRSKLIIDDIYVWNLFDDVNKCLQEEQSAIAYAKPILNNSGFAKYEELCSGNPHSLEFVLGYIKLIDQLKNEKNKKIINKFIEQIAI